jgi:hypothetical protein
VVELDPGFAPAYTHLLNNAFMHRPDSARAARLIEIYHRLAPTSTIDQENQIAFALAFGDSLDRMEAYSALDTLPPRSWLAVADQYLNHPRFWGARETVLGRAMRSRIPADRLRKGLIRASQLDNALSLGRLREALGYLEDPLMLAGIREAGLYRSFPSVRGAPRPGPVVGPDSVSSLVQSLVAWFYAGARAADDERWEDYAFAVGRLTEVGPRLGSDGDSAGARFVRGVTDALDGRRAWITGDRERALLLLQDGQRTAAFPASRSLGILNGTIRWWTGELLLESGRPGDAAQYFESFWNDPLAAERLGPIYEQIGEPARAREAYGLVVRAWRGADPELQSRVRAAQAALERLAGSRRG